MSQAKANPTTFRALTPFTRLPKAHRTFLVDDDSSAPHLRHGEYAVIDTADYDPQHGELYLIQYGGGRREIIQATSSYRNIVGHGETLVWFVCDLRGFRQTAVAPGGFRVFVGMSDGPYFTEGLQSKLIGRVVGFASSSLGKLLPAEAPDCLPPSTMRSMALGAQRKPVQRRSA